jgi:DNA-binding NarL/FixJ family response regulator
MLNDFPISILVVEDHKMFRMTLVAVLEEISSNCKVKQAGNGIECIRWLEKQAFHLVLLDINMPEMDGIECMSIIQERWPNQKVAVLTQYDQMGFLKKMRELGAAGYFLKNMAAEDLQNAVMSMILENSHFFNKRIDSDLKKILTILSFSELQVLSLLTNDLSSEDISQKLYISVSTVNNHRCAILRKLNLKNTAGMVKWALQNGFTTKLEL